MYGVSRSLFVVTIFAVISSCAVTSRTTPFPSRSADELIDWQASGRIAVAGATSGGSGSFTWSQSGSTAKIQVRGPVGIGSLRLTLSDESLRIETGDGQQFEADAAQTELTTRLGAQVPVRDLRYWIVGIAAPGEHEWTVTADTAALIQQEWRIDYQRYAVTQGVRLPMKLVAVSGPAKVRIVIDRWKVVR